MTWSILIYGKQNRNQFPAKLKFSNPHISLTERITLETPAMFFSHGVPSPWCNFSWQPNVSPHTDKVYLESWQLNNKLFTLTKRLRIILGPLAILEARDNGGSREPVPLAARELTRLPVIHRVVAPLRVHSPICRWFQSFTLDDYREETRKREKGRIILRLWI